MKYIQNNVEIEAICYDGDNCDTVAKFYGKKCKRVQFTNYNVSKLFAVDEKPYIILTEEKNYSNSSLEMGEWLVKDDREFRILNSKDFNRKYRKI